MASSLVPRRDVRASDLDRDRAAAALRRHFAAGRLDHDELEERLELACAARWRGELRRALAGLPSDGPQRMARGARRVDAFAVRAHVTAFTAANGTVVAAWAALGADGFFWPAIVLLPTGALLTTHLAARRALRRALRRRHR
ncbi:MAG TPA: DUF1707 domain-containing protein [Baekduia sp.]|nr:DUF1707 domain-containing protein [Baekduia sp.]